ncbi:MAG TPA: hypothetical protein VMG11_02310 [Steroidobacteraceae bacterium]|nr:hypothetical protein [Steroidobacteraceae bacterium]
MLRGTLAVLALLVAVLALLVAVLALMAVADGVREGADGGAGGPAPSADAAAVRHRPTSTHACSHLAGGAPISSDRRHTAALPARA